MPILSRFFGITIRMYFQQAEHNPPHIHAFYGESSAAISIQTMEVIDGNLPPGELAFVQEWIALYQNNLLRMWETQTFEKLPPLQ